MTTISEELVRLEEAVERYKESKSAKSSNQAHSDIMMWMLNCPVSFRKLGELEDSAWELFEDSPEEDRIMIEVDSAAWGRFCKAIASLEQPND